MELCLGTVQLGMDYGIMKGTKPDEEYAIRILDYAIENGIRAIDTATAYGTAEELVGKFLKRKTITRDKLFISTKLPPNILDDKNQNDYERIIRTNLEESLKRLNTDYVDAYLLHSSRYAFDTSIIEALIMIKDSGLAKRVGVSVYEPEEAKACFKNEKLGFIQAPYSIFDHRMKEKGILEYNRNTHCEIHTRSAFLQGLICMREEDVPPFLDKARPLIRKIDDTCKKEGFTRVELAMAYVKREKRISHLVFGVNTVEQLAEDIKAFQTHIDEVILDEMEHELGSIDADIVIPSLWKK